MKKESYWCDCKGCTKEMGIRKSAYISETPINVNGDSFMIITEIKMRIRPDADICNKCARRIYREFIEKEHNRLKHEVDEQGT